MKYTIQAIADALINSQTALDSAYDSHYSYYLHHDGQKFVSTLYDAEKTFEWPVPYIDDIWQKCEEAHPDDSDAAEALFWSEVKKTETLDNPDFRAVVEGLTEEINEWLEEV